MRSIIAEDKENSCFICGSCDRIEEHHIFGGPDRQVSEKYGLKVHRSSSRNLRCSRQEWQGTPKISA